MKTKKKQEETSEIDDFFDGFGDGEEIVGDMEWIDLEVGEDIAGIVIEMVRRDSKYRKNQLIVSLDTPEGIKTLGCKAKLDQLITRGRIRLNDIVKIRRVADVDIKKGHPMANYRLAVQRPPGSPNDLPF